MEARKTSNDSKQWNIKYLKGHGGILGPLEVKRAPAIA
jgi:hypothetical protein